MRAARIGGDVAADGTGDLTRRIGCVVEAVAGNRVGDGEVGDARLDHRAPIVEIDLDDPFELTETEGDAVSQRKRPAGQRRARAARNHLDSVFMAIAQHPRDLLGGLRQYRNQRQLLVGGEAVRFVNPEFVLVGDHPFTRNDSTQIVGDLPSSGDDLGVRFRHQHVVSSRPALNARGVAGRFMSI